MEKSFFQADSIQVGLCGNACCRAVHFQLFDGQRDVRAQAVIACEEVEAIVVSLRESALLARAADGGSH